MMKTTKIILSGGGTGGHIYPALAIADALKQHLPDAKFLFVGAHGKMEMEKVPKAGYPIVGLWISGIQRNLSIKNILFPLKLIVSLCQATYTIIKFRPHIVIGTGGFASGPVLFMASLLGIPTLIQEQNSYPGITNKLLAKRANSICVSYDGLTKYFPKDKLVLTGNPVRQDILDLSHKTQKAKQYFNLKKSKVVVLVLGGSLGAKKINELIESKLPYFEKHNVELIWQCGALYYKRFCSYDTQKNVHVLEYIQYMDLAYAAADIIISRAGASSVSELCIVGKPVIFIPSPNVAEDHQTKNAQAISDQNAAILIKESNLELEFDAKFLELLSSESIQKKLKNNIKKLAKPLATKSIVNEIENLLSA